MSLKLLLTIRVLQGNVVVKAHHRQASGIGFAVTVVTTEGSAVGQGRPREAYVHATALALAGVALLVIARLS